MPLYSLWKVQCFLLPSDADSNSELSGLVEDKEIAARAVAFVVNSTRKGIVPLCADIANLLRAKRRYVQLTVWKSIILLMFLLLPSLTFSSVTFFILSLLSATISLCIFDDELFSCYSLHIIIWLRGLLVFTEKETFFIRHRWVDVLM